MRVESCRLVDTTPTGRLGPSEPLVALVLRASRAQAAGHHGVPVPCPRVDRNVKKYVTGLEEVQRRSVQRAT